MASFFGILTLNMDTNETKLKDFLVIAKKATYATSGEGGERRLQDGTKEFVFKKGLYTYRDRYHGSNPFIGQEIVFNNKKPIWGMNYCGRVINKTIDSHEVYSFLKKALQKVTKHNPYRGPRISSYGQWKYSCTVKGSIGAFSGQEKIFWDKKKAYELLFHGGVIK